MMMGQDDTQAMHEHEEGEGGVKRFIAWLQAQLDEKGWSRTQAAKRGGVSASMFDKVINGLAEPGLDFYRGVSRAFNVPLEEVLRIANVLPSNRPTDDATARLLAELNDQPPEVRDGMLSIVQTILRLPIRLSDSDRQYLRLLNALPPDLRDRFVRQIREELQGGNETGHEASDSDSEPDEPGKVA